MKGMLRVLTVTALTAVLMLALTTAVASAHERRTVSGKYQLTVGFATEPALSGESNGLDLRVTVPSENNRPVEGLEQSLKATVIVGGGARTLDLPLEARFGQPGAYAANFIPTRAGSYIFQLSGTIEGTAVTERFESGPGRFEDVRSPEFLQFPDKVPEGKALADELAALRQEAATARLLGAAGLLLGIAGMAAAGLALRRQSRPSTQASPLPTDGSGERRQEAA